MTETGSKSRDGNQVDGPASALGHDLVAEIHRRILDGRIARGSWLRQDGLARELGVSRTPIREAFRALQGQGIIEMVPRRGAFVRGPTPRDIREIFEVRAELESFAAELAADRARDSQLAMLRETNAQFGEIVEAFVARKDDDRVDAETGEAWMQANEQFHSVILEAAANHQLDVSVQHLFARFPRNMTFLAFSSDSHLLRENVRGHAAIAEAIESRDPARARLLMRAHLRRAGELLVRWFEAEVWTEEPLRP